MKTKIVEGARLAVHDEGTGTPVLFIHGTAGNRTHWLQVREKLNAAGCSAIRAISPELFGYGMSDGWVASRDAGIDDYCAVVAAALEDVRRPAILVGHSMGGAVGLHYALRNPDRIARLVLIEPADFHLLANGFPDDEDLLEDLSIVGRALQDGARQLRADMRAAAAGKFIDYWNGAGVWRNLPLAFRHEIAGRLDSIARDFAMLRHMRVPLSDYAILDKPVMLLRGGRSPRPIQRIAGLLSDLLPAAHLLEVPEAGHMMPLTHPGKIAACIHRQVAVENVAAAALA